LLATLCASAPAHAAGAAHAPESAVVLVARVDGSVGLSAAGGAPAAGLGVSAGLPFGAVQLNADLGLGADLAPTPRITALLDAHLPIVSGAKGALSLTAGLGTGWWVDAPRPLARVGVAYDGPAPADRGLRASLAWQYGGGGAGAVIAGVGVAWRAGPRVARPASLVTERDPTAPPPPLPLLVTPAEAMVWLPHPVCEWVPASSLGDRDPASLLGVTVQVRAPGYLPADVTLDAAGGRVLSLTPAPAYGSVVVVAFPGDRVRIGASVFPIAPDGTAVFSAPEGPVAVEVVGGGRSVVIDGAVAAGYALWLRAPVPAPLTLSFPVGSAEVPADVLPALRAYVAALGDHQLRIVGAYASEEAEANRRVASARAEAVAAALVAAGAPAGAVKVLSSTKPPKDALEGAHGYVRVESLSASAPEAP
jgi:hypothetical protein